MTIKTDVSRFHIHDELTSPDASAPIIKSIQTAGGAVPKFLGVLAESPASLRAYMRMRTELHSGVLPEATRQRIALGVAEHRGDEYSIAQYARTARTAGLGLDEVNRARKWKSSDEKEQTLLILLEETFKEDGTPKTYMVEEAREAGWTDEEIIEAISELAMSEFQSLFSRAAELPLESSDPAILRAVA